MSGICPIKTKLLSACLLLLLSGAAYAGPPPGAPGYRDPAAASAASFNNLNIGTGLYFPSLKMLNAKFEADGMTTMDDRIYFTLGAPMRDRENNMSVLIGASYWKGVSEELIPAGSEFRLHIISFYIPLLYEFPVLEQQLYIGAGLSTRSNFMILKYDDPETYYTASAGSITWGPAFSLEYYPFPATGNFSLTLYMERIMLSLVLASPTVTSSADSTEYGEKLVTSDGKDLLFETSGMVLGLGANFYF